MAREDEAPWSPASATVDGFLTVKCPQASGALQACVALNVNVCSLLPTNCGLGQIAGRRHLQGAGLGSMGPIRDPEVQAQDSKGTLFPVRLGCQLWLEKKHSCCFSVRYGEA